ncbi:H-NS family nucleoid-associated regulatory protein [Acidovorax sp. sic0104]|uniref:H-NS histone family protein n=1 Tax=Acidovorax sp. sic0104 TaxID=2854784 RepID=UPI001C48231C|nr:H-NS histone family protein [Acidovorax sp. sic0104]MBV7542093.1 H-NS histone family protein [Acidovorax sp. sic0104]
MTENDLHSEGLTEEEALAKIEHYRRVHESLRKNKLAGVIASIKDLVKQHDLKPADIFPGISKFHGTPEGRKHREPMYRGPQGQLWGGGSGRKPDWVRQIEAAGESLDKYLIDKTPGKGKQAKSANR